MYFATFDALIKVFEGLLTLDPNKWCMDAAVILELFQINLPYTF